MIIMGLCSSRGRAMGGVEPWAGAPHPHGTPIYLFCSVPEAAQSIRHSDTCLMRSHIFSMNDVDIERL